MAAGTVGGAPTERVAYRRLLWVGPVAGLVAALANVVVFLLASALGAVPGDVLPQGQPPVTVGAVGFSSFVPALLGAVLFGLLGRFTRRPVRNFRVVAVGVLVLSFATPFTIPGAPVAMILALLLMHAIAAVVVTGVLTALGRKV